MSASRKVDVLAKGAASLRYDSGYGVAHEPGLRLLTRPAFYVALLISASRACSVAVEGVDVGGDTL